MTSYRLHEFNNGEEDCQRVACVGDIIEIDDITEGITAKSYRILKDDDIKHMTYNERVEMMARVVIPLFGKSVLFPENDVGRFDYFYYYIL